LIHVDKFFEVVINEMRRYTAPDNVPLDASKPVNFALGKIVLTSDGRICEVKTRARYRKSNRWIAADQLRANRMRNEASIMAVNCKSSRG